MAQKQRWQRRGFTLGEILTVIAVLLVLAALLFPVLGRVRARGRQTACQSNLRQIGLAVQQYLQDNDSTLPAFINWREATASYIKSPAIFMCPSAPPLPQNPLIISEEGKYNFFVGFLNTLVVEHENGKLKQGFAGVNDSSVANASKIFVSGDGPVVGFSRDVPMPRSDACGLTMGNGKPDTLQTLSVIHSGGGNYLFYDGHVKWMTPESMAQALCDAAPYLQPPFRADGEHIQ